MFRDVFGRFLQEKRLTAYRVAKETGISQGLMGTYARGEKVPSSKNLAKIADYLCISVDELLGKESPDANNSKGVSVPVYGKIAAGLPIEAVENIIDYEEISEAVAATGEFLALQVAGDSMQPRMTTGDVVIIKKQPDVESGQIAAVMINGENATLKKIIKNADGITLVSLNPLYEPKHYTNQQIIDLPIYIIGRVVELRAKF